MWANGYTAAISGQEKDGFKEIIALKRGTSLEIKCSSHPAKRGASNGGDPSPPWPFQGESKGGNRNPPLVAFLCGSTAFLSATRKEMGWKEHQCKACTRKGGNTLSTPQQEEQNRSGKEAAQDQPNLEKKNAAVAMRPSPDIRIALDCILSLQSRAIRDSYYLTSLVTSLSTDLRHRRRSRCKWISRCFL